MRNIGKRKKHVLEEILLNHIKNNLKQYIIALMLFVIGMICGIIVISKITNTQYEEISYYLNNFISSLKDDAKIDKILLLKSTMTKNFWIVIAIWFMGSTVIGIPIIYMMLSYRGFCLGYAISAIIAVFGVGKGLLFIFPSLFIHNILFIPALFALVVSGNKVYKNIVKNKRKDNIKQEIIRHTMFSLIILICIEISALIETYISVGLLQICAKYI